MSDCYCCCCWLFAAQQSAVAVAVAAHFVAADVALWPAHYCCPPLPLTWELEGVMLSRLVTSYHYSPDVGEMMKTMMKTMMMSAGYDAAAVAAADVQVVLVAPFHYSRLSVVALPYGDS